MSLSEVMRNGIRMSGPLEGALLGKGPSGQLYSCALGAVHLGAGGEFYVPDREVYVALETQWPELKNKVDIGGNVGVTDLQSAIIARNDWDHWTREAIADWLEGLGY